MTNNTNIQLDWNDQFLPLMVEASVSFDITSEAPDQFVEIDYVTVTDKDGEEYSSLDDNAKKLVMSHLDAHPELLWEAV
ncbi:hypothetical protein N9K75_02830 [bacterium]|nr:hypothetical protein [bacterium]